MAHALALTGDPKDVPAFEITCGQGRTGPSLRLTRQAHRDGARTIITVHVANTGDTGAKAARFAENLSAVPGATTVGETLTTSGTLSHDDSLLRWTGDVPAGDDVSIRYAVRTSGTKLYIPTVDTHAGTTCRDTSPHPATTGAPSGKTGTKTGTETGAETAAGTGVEGGPQAETRTETGSETGSGSGTGTGTETKADTEAEAEAEAESGTGPGRPSGKARTQAGERADAIAGTRTIRQAYVRSTRSAMVVGGGDPAPGSVLEYTVTATNTGDDTAVGVVLTAPIPADTVFVPGSISVATGPGVGPKTDRTGDDQGDFAGDRVRVRLGTGANAVSGGSLAPGRSTSVRFRVTLGADSPGTAADTGTTVEFSGSGTASRVSVPAENIPLAAPEPVSTLAMLKTVSPGTVTA
ncbi:DUF11 domain-containing protein [Streptosporangium longisporum]